MAKVINCAHRGAMAYEPENTLRAFRRAAEMGADQIELDVFLTSDGVPVVCHDAMLKTEPRGGDVRKMPLTQIRELRFRGEPIPTLQEAIDLCAEKKMLLNIEIKDRACTEKAVEAVRKNNLYSRCQVSNFYISMLRRVKSLDARVPTGYIVLPGFQWLQLEQAKKNNCESVNPLHSATGTAFVNKAHRRGIKVIAWTCNTPEAMRGIIAAGVDGIITNRPDVLTGVKKEMGIE